MKSLAILFFSCSTSLLQAQNNFNYLDINQVKAGISNIGRMHYDPSANWPAYEVPAGSGAHSDFFTGLWIGGYDNANQLHLAAQTYRQFGDDFWPGPLDTTNGNITAPMSGQYDKIWKLNQSDINTFIANFNNGNVQNGSYTSVADLLSWPARGAGAQSRNLAPFADVNHNGIYDPMTGGDYPIIKGDQSLYYIFNDNLNHQSSGAAPMKVEIHATAYAYGNSATASQHSFLSKATFYNYKIINRSNLNYNNVFVTLWTDVDLGYYGDDYIGCDVQGNYGYCYNADNYDESVGGVVGYGSNIPAAGYQIVKGPLANADGIDNNNNGIIDESCEQQLMSRFNYFNNSFAGTPIQQTDPQSAAQYYNYMSGYWRDNTPFTCGGNSYGGTIQTPFVYPGTTYTNGACGASAWTELTAGNTPNDRRYMIGVGPFNFNAGEVQEIEYVHCTSFPAGATTALMQLKTDMQLLKNFSDAYFPVTCVATSIQEQQNSGSFILYPNPANDELTLSFKENTSLKSTISLMDVCGKVLLTKENTELDKITLNVQELASGIYFIKASSNGKSIVKKFVKE